MDSSPSKESGQLPSFASTEHASMRRPSLLPAFEPSSSSPAPLRATKRKFDEHKAESRYYPTPVPTSSTGILLSSPTARPALQRTVSTLTERAPLGAVPTLDIPLNGEPILMGRSSNSSDYQLSANRLISRVHIRAAYQAPTPSHTFGEVVIQCIGWNGAKVHCRGEVHELGKGETFASDKPQAQIMVDVQDTRVLILWPSVDNLKSEGSVSARSASFWKEESPSCRNGAALERFASSPPPIYSRLQSPESPTPANRTNQVPASAFLTPDPADTADSVAVQIYEDSESNDEPAQESTPRAGSPIKRLRSRHFTRSTALADEDHFSDGDEENDPIVHSFGPFGENLLSRFESIKSVGSPKRPRRPLNSSFLSPHHSPGSEAPVCAADASPITNHVVNQLAYSRLHSLPLSTIFNSLPAELKDASSTTAETARLTTSELKKLLDDIPCVGEISREGKDAAGKALENEFYYVPEMDQDELRKIAVTESMGKTGLRATRKQHKQYYWKRPRN
ncbi:target of SBF [Cryomyces antarcticus]|nr:target of SBF [Cryomyces antarcticus]